MFEVVSHILDRSNSFQVQFIPNLFHQHTTASTKFYISLFSQGGIDMINWSRSKNQTSWLAVARAQFLPEFYPEFTPNFNPISCKSETIKIDFFVL